MGLKDMLFNRGIKKFLLAFPPVIAIPIWLLLRKRKKNMTEKDWEELNKTQEEALENTP